MCSKLVIEEEDEEMWVIATKNLYTFLCKYKQDGKLSATTDAKKAFIFEAKVDAEKYISNQMPKSIRDNYVVIPFSEACQGSETTSIQESSEFEWLNLRAEESLDSFRQVNAILKQIPSYKKMLEHKRQEVEDALVDIYHYIEFNNIGTVQAYKIYKKEQALLQLRRKVKEEQFCVEQLMKYINISESRVSDYINSLDNTKERSYIQQIEQDLSEQLSTLIRRLANATVHGVLQLDCQFHCALHLNNTSGRYRHMTPDVRHP